MPKNQVATHHLVQPLSCKCTDPIWEALFVLSNRKLLLAHDGYAITAPAVANIRTYLQRQFFKNVDFSVTYPLKGV